MTQATDSRASEGASLCPNCVDDQKCRRKMVCDASGWPLRPISADAAQAPADPAIQQAVRNGDVAEALKHLHELKTDHWVAIHRIERILSAAAAPKEPTEPVPAQPSDASAVQAAEQFPLPPAKVQAYADTNGLPPDDVKTCESCPTCGAPVTVFQPKVGEPIYTHKPADGVDLPDGGQHG
jgi:hypothetical protein